MSLCLESVLHLNLNLEFKILAICLFPLRKHSCAISPIIPVIYLTIANALTFLPPAKEVWGKVIFSEACVKNSVHWGGGALPGPGVGVCVCSEGGAWSGGVCVPSPGGAWSGVAWSGGAWSGGCLLQGGPGPGGSCSQGGCSPGVPGGDLPGTATAAGGTHPTGMHSCFALR